MKDVSSQKELRHYAEIETPSWAKMLRQAPSTAIQTIVFVEGKSDWDCFENRLFNKTLCKVKSLRGKKFAITALQRCRSISVPGVIAVLDADFDRLNGNSLEAEDLFYCDGHDAEIMMSLTNAFDDLVRIVGDKEKIELAKEKTGRDIRELLLNMGAPIGAAMIVNFEKDWKLGFKELDYERFIDAQAFRCDENKLAVFLTKRRPDLCIDPRIYAKLIQKKVCEIENPRDLCRGHDLSAIFAMCFDKKCLGDYITRSNNIEEALRREFGLAEFKTTELYRKLTDWQEQNSESPYRVF